MNSSNMPDKHRPLEKFRDHIHMKKAIEGLKRISREDKLFMLAFGFKLPQTEVHVPYQYYKIYDNQTKRDMWRLTKKEMR